MSVLSNGYLLALTAAVAVEFDVEFLVIGGGGDESEGSGSNGGAGGGAGGYISSVSGESSGGGGSVLTAPTLLTGDSFTVTVGAVGSDSVFSGSDSSSTSFSHTALAGGSGVGDDGGSGAGADIGGTTYSRPPGSGTANQGFDGGDGGVPATSACTNPSNYCNPFCYEGGGIGGAYGGGGGAGAAGSGQNGGAGVQSSITGTATYYAAGGAGTFICPTQTTSTSTGGTGVGNYGSGGGRTSAAQSGAVILRYPNTRTISNPGGGLTISTSTDGSDKVSTITAGTGSVSFS